MYKSVYVKIMVIGFIAIMGVACFLKSRRPPANPVPGQVWADPNSGIDFCYCPPGSFSMGSQSDDAGHADDQSPQHTVAISKGFWLGRTVVTQAQWKAVMKVNPSAFKGDNRPVEMVSWYDCQEFVQKLNGKSKRNLYRFPTEAEWEYACGAGNPDPAIGDLDSVAWCKTNSGDETNPVGQKKANAWGLFDMLGNVREWCSDWRGAYPSNPQTDPQGANTGSYRVNRGGSWSCRPYVLHRAYRWYYTPDFRDNDLGFRPVLAK